MAEIYGGVVQLKILQVVSTPPFEWSTGGPARVTLELSLALADIGHEVTILSTSIGKSADAIDEANINSVEFKTFNNISRHMSDNKLYFSPKLITYLKENISEYDIVHLQDLLSPHAAATRYFARKNSVPYVLTPHGSVPWLNQNKLVNRIYSGMFGTDVIKDAKCVFPLNKTESNLVEEFNPNRVKIIPNGVNPDNYNPIQENWFEQKHQISASTDVILYLGRLHSSKSVTMLVKAMNLLNEEGHTGFKLVLAGPDDGVQKKLEELVDKYNIQDLVHFAGFLSEKDKVSALSSASIFATPNFDGFPITFLEAAACGTPTITTTKGDEIEWLSDVGIVCDSTVPDYAIGIAELLTNRPMRQKFERNARETIKESLNWSSISKTIEEEYYRAL